MNPKLRPRFTKKSIVMVVLFCLSMMLYLMCWQKARSVEKMWLGGIKKDVQGIVRIGGQPQVGTTPSCSPCHRVVFIKTHKTGSTTITTMLQRYGSNNRDLNFALPKKTHIFCHTDKFFNNACVYQLRPKNRTGVWPAYGEFHILANHARYNRRAMDELIPNATYFTILRGTAARFESAFDYHKTGRRIRHRDSLAIFLNDTKKYSKIVPVHIIRNEQIRDLGLNVRDIQNLTAVETKIAALASELDLVMINEYFDESLILLKRLLCWDMDDIVYLSKLVRKAHVRRAITPDLRAKILELNRADELLYQHFNQTFWRKVEHYGPDFRRDLETFRQLNKNTTEMCTQNAKTKWDGHSTGMLKPVGNASEKCQDMMREDFIWTPLLRDRLYERSLQLEAPHP